MLLAPAAVTPGSSLSPREGAIEKAHEAILIGGGYRPFGTGSATRKVSA